MGAGKRRILVVDDQAAVRHGPALVLGEEGCGCREEALTAARREAPDLAVVDLSPPQKTPST